MDYGRYEGDFSPRAIDGKIRLFDIDGSDLEVVGKQAFQAWHECDALGFERPFGRPSIRPGHAEREQLDGAPAYVQLLELAAGTERRDDPVLELGDGEVKAHRGGEQNDKDD